MNFKHFLSIILVFALSFGLCSIALADETAEVPEGYTPIYTAEDLNNIRNDLSGKYILMNDIDLSTYENWESIGTYDSPFAGKFDGNSKVINNLKIQVNSEDKVYYYALFGVVTGGVISNTALRDCSVYVKAKSDSFRGVSVSGLVALGNNDSIIENCIVSGKISAETDNMVSVGGIAASFAGTIKNCQNLASVYAYVPSEYDCRIIQVGGIAGNFSGLLEKSSNQGTVEVKYNYHKKYSAYVYLGGIAGNSMEGGSIGNCYNIGTVIGNTNQAPNLGGISGYSATVRNSHNYGILNCAEDSVAYGITGITEFWFENPWEENGEKVDFAELKNCYYLNNVEKATSYFEEEHITNILALTKEEFANKDNFIGFDFENIWTMSEELGCPVLLNQPEIPENAPETPTTEPSTEPTTEPSTEPITQPSKSDCFLSELWIVKTLKHIVEFLVNVMNDICNTLSTLILNK